MKRFKYNIFGIASAVLMLTACNSFLDVDAPSYKDPDKFYSNTTEASIAISGIFNPIASEDCYGQGLTIFDSGADEGYYNRRTDDNWTVGIYRHTPSDQYVLGLWSSLYKSIDLSNLFLEKLKKENFEPAVYDVYIAEAKFMRAFCYLTLTQWWEEVPLRLKSTKDRSDNHCPAASLPEIYDQIESDFLFAIKYLPHSKDANYVAGTPNQMAARALLARMYLKKAGYPNLDQNGYLQAREQCDTIIRDGWHSLTVNSDNKGYRNIFLSYIQGNYNLKESLFEISYKYMRQMGINVDGRNGQVNGLRMWLVGGADGTPSSYAMLSPSPVLDNSYEAGDVRKEWNDPGIYYNQNASYDFGDIKRVAILGLNYTPGKFRRWEPFDYADIDITLPSNETSRGVYEPYVVLDKSAVLNRNFTAINFPVVRYSDVLLMFAEADNQVNGAPTAEAIAAVDQIRSRVGLSNLGTAKPLAISSKENFFKEIVEERMRELCFEGLRRNDLVRWGLLESRLKFLDQTLRITPGFSEADAQSSVYVRGPQNFNPHRHLSMPYPLQEVTINNRLTQKLEWTGVAE